MEARFNVFGALGEVAREVVGRGLAPADRALDRMRQALGDASRTVKFLRGRAMFDPRGDDVYVASYPRSGTTWVQVIAHLLVSGADDLEFAHISDVSPWWERSLAHGSDAARRFAAMRGPRLFKTHLHRRWLPAGARTIYVQRDPGDVAVSYYHLYRDYLGFDGDLGAFIDRLIAGEVQYGRWSDHVASWSASPSPGLLRVSYEELRRDPEEPIAAIAGLLGVAATARRVRDIADATRFDRMKRHQDKFDHLGELVRQWGIKPGRFVRRGGTGESRPLIAATQRRRLERSRFTSPPRLPPWKLSSFLH
jgi:hypothetical protein